MRRSDFSILLSLPRLDSTDERMMARGEAGMLLDEFPYIRVGDGPRTLVILPGATDPLFDGNYPRIAVHVLRRFLHRFVDDYTVYLVNRPRGLGAGTTIRDMGDDYARVLEGELGSAAVWGISLGGCIAQQLAVEHPNYVEELVLGATGTRIDDGGRDIVHQMRRRAYEHDWQGVRAILTAEVYPDTDWRRFIYPMLTTTVGRFALPTPAVPADMWISLEAELDYDGRKSVDRIEAPTLVIGGSEDPFFPPAILRETAETIPNSELHVIQGAKHGAFLTHKPMFEKRVRTFLNG